MGSCDQDPCEQVNTSPTAAAPVSVGGDPYGIAVSPDSSIAYVNVAPGTVVPRWSATYILRGHGAKSIRM